MNASFQDKIVLVTGAGKGAGRTLAQAFATQGARVAANDISPMNVEALVDEINAEGGEAKAYVHDIAKKVAVQAMLNDIGDELGPIDILVNCAHVEPRAVLFEIDEWDLHRVFEVNAIGTLLMMQSAARVMREHGGGTILNVISAGHGVTYTASRAGIAAATGETARELSAYGIRLHTLTLQEATLSTQAVTAALGLCADESIGESGKVLQIS